MTPEIKEKYRLYHKKYQKDNFETLKDKKKEYVSKNMLLVKKRNKDYYIKTKNSMRERRSLCSTMWQKKNPEKSRLMRQASSANKFYSGKLKYTTVQMVYEDNIKKFGTLTCYLCEKPIQFGRDCLEHIVSSKNGGTNDYSNLGIACKTCNSKKNNKDLYDFLKEQKTT